jgi:esterase
MAGADRFVTCNGLRLHYLEAGDVSRPTAVLLHGLRGSAHTWDAVVASLAGEYHTLAMDLRGRGESDWGPKEQYNRDYYVQDLEQFADQLCPEPFNLIGHSLGGAIGYVYSAARPHRVRALVVEDMGPLTNPPAPGAERIAREMDATPARFDSWTEAKAFVRTLRPEASEDVIESVADSSLKYTAEGTVTWKYDLAGIRGARGQIGDLRPAIETLRCPTLVLRGTRSDILLPDNARWIAQANSAIRCIDIADAGHFVHDDNLQDFSREVAAFLASLDGP